MYTKINVHPTDSLMNYSHGTVWSQGYSIQSTVRCSGLILCAQYVDINSFHLPLSNLLSAFVFYEIDCFLLS